MIEKPIYFGSYKINDQTTLNLSVSPNYYIRVTSVDGLFNNDISYEAHPIPANIGERSGDVLRRGKGITLKGDIRALNMGKLREAQRYLQQMFWSTAIQKLRFTQWGEPEIYLNCRVSQDLEMVDEVTQHEPLALWVVGLRADDPRTYLSSNDSIYPTFQLLS